LSGGELGVATEIAWFIAACFAALSLYGWWFYFSVGPTHGAGAEIGVVAGSLALVAAAVAAWLKRRENRRR
jgi:hypothetical protein